MNRRPFCWAVCLLERSQNDSLPVSLLLMDHSFSGLMAYARTEEGRKKLRYCGVSTFFVPFGQILVQMFGLWLDNYTVASLLAAAIVTIPNFFANKHYVWRLTSRENLHRHLLVFWIAMMLGVCLATLFTHLVEIVMVGQTQPVRGASVFAAQLLGYGIVWIGRFLLLNHWLFKVAEEMPPHPDCVQQIDSAATGARDFSADSGRVAAAGQADGVDVKSAVSG